MFFGLKTILRSKGDPVSRRTRRRCVPSIAVSASCLEDRMLLSGAAEAASDHHAAHHFVRHASAHRIDRATGLHAPAAAATAVSGGMPSESPTISFSSSASTGSVSGTRPSFLINTLPSASNVGSIGLNVKQAPDLGALRPGFGGGGGSPSFSSSSTTSSSLSSTIARTISTTSTSISNTVSSLSQLPLSQLPLSQLPLSQLPLSQIQNIVTSVNTPTNTSFSNVNSLVTALTPTSVSTML